MPIGGLFQGVLGWLFFGAAIYSWLTYRNYGVTNSPQESFSDPGVGGGPWAHPTNSQTPVPIGFGTARGTFPIFHYRLEGDNYQDMWLACVVGEDWNTLNSKYNTSVGTIWLNDTPLSQFSRYTTDTELYDREHDWAQFYPTGRGCNIYWKSEGTHVFQEEAEVDKDAESYNLQASHDAGEAPIKCTVRLIHQFEAGGTTQNYKVSILYLTEVTGSPEIILFEGEVYKHATQTVEAGKDSETIEVAGTHESVYETNLPYRGTFKVVIQLNSASNEGKLYLDSIELEDATVQSEAVESYGTSILLIHVRDIDGTLVKPTITGMETGGPSNPAEALLWLLQNKEVGLGLESEYIDDISFEEVASKCDEYGFSFNRVYCSSFTFETALSDLTKCGRMLLGDYGGKIACIFDEEISALNTRVVDLQTMASNVNYGDANLQSIPNRFLIKYVDEEVESTAQDLVLEDISLQQKAGVVNEKTVEIYGVTSQAKAWELGWYHALWAQASKWIEFDIKPILWDLSPGSVITTLDSQDPFINEREWMLVGFDETEPNKYKAKGIEYKREAFHPEGYVEEYPDVYIEDYIPSSSEKTTKVPSGSVNLSLLSAEALANGETRVSLQLSGIPSTAEYIKVYRSYDGENFALLTELQALSSPLTYEYNESAQWTFIWWKATIRTTEGETSLLGAPTIQAYIVGSEETYPGYGKGEYGRQPYGY